MKSLLKSVLQKILGIGLYLRVLGIVKVMTLRWIADEKSYLFLLKRLSDTSCLLDIGANIGYLAVPAARRVRRGKVICFEPLPFHVEAIRFLARLFGCRNITVHQLALSDKNGLVNMTVPRMTGGGIHSSAAKVVDEHIKQPDVLVVPSCRLDDFKELKGVKIDAMKVDVENHEYQLFLGGLETIRNNKPMILCELWNNQQRERVVGLLSDNGYSPYVVKAHRLVRYQNEPYDDRMDFLFFRTEHLD